MRLFIASPVEALPLCEALRDELLDRPWPGRPGRHLRDVLDVEVWNGAFHPGHHFLEDLERASTEADFAVFVCDPIGRGKRGELDLEITSANVLFEYGLFLGRLGRDRCFLLLPAGHDLYLPTDAQGITRLHFHDLPARLEVHLRAALHAAAVQIAERIHALGEHRAKLLYQRMATFTHVLEKGLEDLYEQRKDALGPILERIATSRRSLEIYARVYLSELIKESKRLSEAILAAVVRGAEAGVTEPYEIRLVALDPGDQRTVAQLWRIEDPDDASPRWKGGAQEYREGHLLGAVPSHYDSLWHTLRQQIADRRSRHGALGRTIRVRRAWFRDYLTPYSVVLIDREMLWVGLYTFTRVLGSDKNYGSFTPTMKLVDLEPGKTSWFDRFCEEIRRVERNEIGPEIVIHEFAV